MMNDDGPSCKYRGGGESAVRMRSSDNVVVTDCHFTMTGMIGLHAQGCKNVHVTRSDAYHFIKA